MAAATFEGAPCSTCGGTLRYVAGRRCVACRRARSRRRYADPVVAAAKRATMDAYYAANAEHLRARRRERYAEFDALAYAQHLLRSRRHKALRRMAERNARDNPPKGT